MTLLTNIRSFLRMQVQSRGITVVPYPLKKYFDNFQIDLVLDVGANIGQYAHELRGLGYRSRIESFEPMTKAFSVLQKRAMHDRNWKVHPFAIGDVETSRDLSISANGPSSSFLPLSQDAKKAAIDLTYVSKESVEVKRLDSLLPELRQDARSIFLKVDTQGFEKNVIDGAGKLLHSFTGIQVELSLTRQYEGELLASQFLELMEAHGFVPYWMLQGYRCKKSMQLKQIDVIFFRKDA